MARGTGLTLSFRSRKGVSMFIHEVVASLRELEVSFPDLLRSVTVVSEERKCDPRGSHGLKMSLVGGSCDDVSGYASGIWHC